MSYQQKILAEINKIEPIDNLEETHLADARAWVESGVELCRQQKPATPAKHLVAYFAVIDRKRKKLLLVDHKKAELWLPAGGHVEPNEHPSLTVQREVQEELFIQADFVQKAPLFVTVTQTVGSCEPHIDVSLWYVLQTSCTETLNFDQREFHAIHWFDPNDIPFERAEPHLKRFVTKLKHKAIL